MNESKTDVIIQTAGGVIRLAVDAWPIIVAIIALIRASDPRATATFADGTPIDAFEAARRHFEAARAGAQRIVDRADGEGAPAR